MRRYFVRPAFLSVLFVASLGSGAGCSAPTPEEQAQRAQAKVQQAEKEDRDMAYFACQEFVERKLKSPASAKWPLADDITSTKISGDKYKVAGYVDSQNSFGAMLRSNFVVIMRKDGDKWFCSESDVLVTER